MNKSHKNKIKTVPTKRKGSSSSRGMKRYRESRKESTPQIIFLSPRKSSRIGTWNVRSMYEMGKTAQVVNEMKFHGIGILGLCETRWNGAGKQRLNTGETMLFSGHMEENAPHSEGVALMLSKEAEKALIKWEAVSPRIITATFRTTKKKVFLNVTQCYAPTNDKEEKVKEEFYIKLQNTIGNQRNGNIKILMVSSMPK